MMRIARWTRLTSSLRTRLGLIGRQIGREANLRRRRKDNAHLQRLNLSPFDWFILVLLLLLMLLALALGAYRGYKFHGRVLEVRLYQNRSGS